MTPELLTLRIRNPFSGLAEGGRPSRVDRAPLDGRAVARVGRRADRGSVGVRVKWFERVNWPPAAGAPLARLSPAGRLSRDILPCPLIEGVRAAEARAGRFISGSVEKLDVCWASAAVPHSSQPATPSRTVKIGFLFIGRPPGPVPRLDA